MSILYNISVQCTLRTLTKSGVTLGVQGGVVHSYGQSQDIVQLWAKPQGTQCADENKEFGLFQQCYYFGGR